jgi:hypothetical protein
VPVLTKKNALIGYLTFQAVSRSRGRFGLPGRKRRSSWKLPVLIGLAVVSAGVLTLVVALMLRKQREPEHLEGYAVSGNSEGPIASIEPEPSPAA